MVRSPFGLAHATRGRTASSANRASDSARRRQSQADPSVLLPRRLGVQAEQGADRDRRRPVAEQLLDPQLQEQLAVARRGHSSQCFLQQPGAGVGPAHAIEHFQHGRVIGRRRGTRPNRRRAPPPVGHRASRRTARGDGQPDSRSVCSPRSRATRLSPATNSPRSRTTSDTRRRRGSRPRRETTDRASTTHGIADAAPIDPRTLPRNAKSLRCHQRPSQP